MLYIETQKEQKLVINLILLFFVIVTYYGNAQQKEDEYYFLEKIIQDTAINNEAAYQLETKMTINKLKLKKYYDFRFNNIPFCSYFAVDSITDTISIDSIKLREDTIKWNIKYKKFNNAFSKDDLEQILNTDSKLLFWNQQNKLFNKKNHLLIKWCDNYCKNSITKPYFNKKKDYAFIMHSTVPLSTTIYLFKKENNSWIIIDKINNACIDF